MSSDRLMRDLPSPEVVAERNRVLGMLSVVIDETIDHVGGTEDPVAKRMLSAFAVRFVSLKRAVREGGSVEEFQADRKPKEAGDGRAV